MDIHKAVYEYPTRHKEGFTRPEIIGLCKELDLNSDAVFEAIGVTTVIVIDGTVIAYKDDVEAGIRQVVSGRKSYDWD